MNGISYLFSYGGMASLGLLCAAGFVLLVGRKEELDYPVLLCIQACSLLPLYLGAKLFGILSLACWRIRAGVPLNLTLIPNSGIVFYGGMLVFLLSMRLLLRRFISYRRASSWGLTVAAVPLFHGFARIGCYFGRCCYGVVAEGAFFSHFFEHRLPVQLIEAGFNFLLFGALVWLFFSRRRLRGRLEQVYLPAYALFRFCLEFFRDDAIRGSIGPFSFSQAVSLCVLGGLLIARYLRKRRRTI